MQERRKDVELLSMAVGLRGPVATVHHKHVNAVILKNPTKAKAKFLTIINVILS